MHVAHENSPRAERRAGRAKTTRSSRRSSPSEKHRAGNPGARGRDQSWPLKR